MLLRGEYTGLYPPDSFGLCLTDYLCEKGLLKLMNLFVYETPIICLNVYLLCSFPCRSKFTMFPGSGDVQLLWSYSVCICVCIPISAKRRVLHLVPFWSNICFQHSSLGPFAVTPEHSFLLLTYINRSGETSQSWALLGTLFFHLPTVFTHWAEAWFWCFFRKTYVSNWATLNLLIPVVLVA